MLRNACVIHMSVVTLTSTTRNAPSVVAKIHRPTAPIRPPCPHSHQPLVRPGLPPPRPAPSSVPATHTYRLTWSTNKMAPPRRNPLTMHKKTPLYRYVDRGGSL